MWTIRRVVDISSAHKLKKYKGPCANVHGHNWRITVTCTGSELDKAGMLIDFRKIKETIMQLDHKLLNEVPFLKGINPTAENIAKALYDEIPYSHSVKVKESAGCEVTYYGNERH